MEKKQLLLISKNNDFVSGIKLNAGFSFELTSVKNVHAGYTMALGYLPDAILIDYSSLGRESVKNLQSFKSTHFLNKSHLFLYGKKEDKNELDSLFKEDVDELLYDSLSAKEICKKIEDKIYLHPCQTNYWKESFMGLFNILEHPVVLLQNEKVIAMNDAFRRHFFIKKEQKINIYDFVDCQNKNKVLEILRNFVRSKHIKANTKTSLLLKDNKRREANITFSKLDKALSGQMLLMINFAKKEVSINNGIGTASKEIENYFASNNSAESFSFTKREKEIISLLCKGYKTKEISETLCISPKTIEKHRSNIVRRTNSDTILESIVYALNHNIIEV